MNMRPEVQLISLASLPRPTPRQFNEIADIALHVHDWDLIWTICRRHAILPLVVKNLKSLVDAIPPDVQRCIRSIAFQNTARSLYHTGVLLQILDLLKNNSILCVPFKGPLLAQLAYDDFSLRSYGDLDLLIFEDDLCRTVRILEQQGFQPELTGDCDVLKAFAKTEDNLAFVGFADRIVIEVHWELSGHYLSRPLGLAQVEPRLLFFPIANGNIQSLCREDLIVYLSVHGAKHQWQRLEWIYSLGEIVRSGANVDWDMVLAQAEKWRCFRMLMLGLLLAKEIVSVDLPSCILERIEQDPLIAGLAADIQTDFFELEGTQSGTEGKARFTRFHLQVRDSYADAFQYGLRLLFSPTIRDWQCWPLPPSLSFFYYVFRPLRLGWSFVFRNS